MYEFILHEHYQKIDCIVAITTYRSLLIVWNPDTHTPIRAILLQPLCARMTYRKDGGARVGGVRSKVE